MTLDQLMDLQYRKLLTVRGMVRDYLMGEMEGSLVMEVSAILLLAQLLTSIENLDAPVMDTGKNAMVGHCLDRLRTSDDPGVTVMLYPEDVEHILALAGTRRLTDELNREVALRFADAANEIAPTMCVGRQHLEEIL